MFFFGSVQRLVHATLVHGDITKTCHALQVGKKKLQNLLHDVSVHRGYPELHRLFFFSNLLQRRYQVRDKVLAESATSSQLANVCGPLGTWQKETNYCYARQRQIVW